MDFDFTADNPSKFMQDCHSGLPESYMEEEMQNRQSFEVASQGGKNTDHADAPSAQQRVAVAPFGRDLLPQPLWRCLVILRHS